jgi:hypothetical protein
MEACLVLPTPLRMRMAICMDILEQYPPSQEEIIAYKTKYPEWPKDLPKISVEFTTTKKDDKE